MCLHLPKEEKEGERVKVVIKWVRDCVVKRIEEVCRRGGESKELIKEDGSIAGHIRQNNNNNNNINNNIIGVFAFTSDRGPDTNRAVFSSSTYRTTIFGEATTCYSCPLERRGGGRERERGGGEEEGIGHEMRCSVG